MAIMRGVVSGGGGGGGGVTAPTLEVGLTLASSSTELEYDIVNNDADNPAAVELAFAESALKAVAYDHGTPQSPSYAVDPGQTRTVSFERDTGAPSYGNPDVTETITGTLADGATVSSSVTVQGIQFKTAVRALAEPRFEFLWDSIGMSSGEVTNTGSVGTSRNAIVYNSPTASSTSDQFEGSLHITASNQYVQAISGQEPLRTDFCRNQDRSYIFVWDNVTDLSTYSYLMISDGNGSNNGPGWTSTGTTYVKSQYCWTGGAVDLSAANGTHSAGGTPEDMLITMNGSEPRRCMMAISYDHAAGTATIRWKQTGHAAGHTYRTSGSNSDSSAGALTVRWVGWSAGSTANSADWRYTAVVDGLVSASLFDQLAGIAGL